MTNQTPEKEPSIYDLASKAYDHFMNWARDFDIEFKKKYGKNIGVPSGNYLREQYDEYLERENIDKYGDPLPPSDEPQP